MFSLGLSHSQCPFFLHMEDGGGLSWYIGRNAVFPLLTLDTLHESLAAFSTLSAADLTAQGICITICP